MNIEGLGRGVVAVVVVLCVVLLLFLAAWASQKQCPKCFKRGAYYLHQRKDGGRDQRYNHNPLMCPSCGYNEYRERVEREIASTPPVVTPRPPTEEEQLQGALVALVAAKGANARRVALESGSKVVLRPDLRQKLLHCASSLEVAEVLAKVGTLKTVAAKRKHLAEAWAKLKLDEVPDELQAQELKQLRELLEEVEGVAMAKAKGKGKRKPEAPQKVIAAKDLGRDEAGAVIDDGIDALMRDLGKKNKEGGNP